MIVKCICYQDGRKCKEHRGVRFLLDEMLTLFVLGSLVVGEDHMVELEGGKEAPAFLNTSETTVITSVGQTAYLHCGVERLGDRAVS